MCAARRVGRAFWDAVSTHPGAYRSPFLKKRLMSTVFDEVEGRFFGAAASAV
jgi:hypothetical protein